MDANSMTVGGMLENNGLAVVIDEGNNLARAFDAYRVMVDKQNNKRIPVEITGYDVDQEKEGFKKYRMFREKMPDNLPTGVTPKAESDMNYDENFDLCVITRPRKFLGSRSEVELAPYAWSVKTVEYKGEPGEDGSPGKSAELLLLDSDNVKLQQKVFKDVVNYLESVNDRSREAIGPDCFKDANKKLEEAIHQIMELQSFINRWPRYLERLNGKIQIKPVKDWSGKSLPLFEKESLGKPYSPKDTVSLSKVLADMVSVAECLKVLHEAGVAHGDIKPGGLRNYSSGLGLRMPERFSYSVNKGEMHYKNFSFYNNSCCAPELRFPGVYGHGNSEKSLKQWDYTHATKESDIWSCGVLLAGVISRIQGGKEALEQAAVLTLPLADYMKNSGLYDSEKIDAALALAEPDKYLLDKKSLLELNLPKENWFARFFGGKRLQVDPKTLSQLVALAKDCTHPDPKKRPNAKDVHERLDKMVGEEKK